MGFTEASPRELGVLAGGGAGGARRGFKLWFPLFIPCDTLRLGSEQPSRQPNPCQDEKKQLYAAGQRGHGKAPATLQRWEQTPRPAGAFPLPGSSRWGRPAAAARGCPGGTFPALPLPTIARGCRWSSLRHRAFPASWSPSLFPHENLSGLESLKKKPKKPPPTPKSHPI